MTCPATVSALDLLGAAVRLDPIHAIEHAARRGGGLARIPLSGKRKFWVVSDPSLLEQILVKEARNFDKNGPVYDVLAQRQLPGDTGGILDGGMFTQANQVLWRQERDICNPFFHQNALGETTLHALELTQDHLYNWRSGQKVELFPMFKDISMGILTHHLFGGQIESKTSARIAKAAADYFERMAWQLVFGMAPTRRLTGWSRYESAGKELGGLLDRIIKKAQEEPGLFQNTVLGKLLDAFDVSAPTGHQLVKGSIGTFFLAGADSTAVVESWACMELAQDHETQDLLRSKIRQKFGQGPILVERLEEQEEVVAFWELALHKHTAFRIIFRNVRTDCLLGDQALKAGDQLFLALHAAHQDPRYWLPEDLTIEHFAEGLTPEERKAHLPYGKGSKLCIGAPLANRVGIAALTVIMRDWELNRPQDANDRRGVSMTSPPIDSTVVVTQLSR